PGCTGVYTPEQEAAWARIVDFVHAQSPARIGLQLGHSGRKGSTKLMWEGIDEPLPSGGWEVVGPSPVPYSPANPVPRELSRTDLNEVTAEFVDCARAGARAGFDLLELHCAHGYLLSSFLSPLANRRTDEYGGSLENRLRYPLEVFDAVRAAWPAERPISVRISATDWCEGGNDVEHAVAEQEYDGPGVTWPAPYRAGSRRPPTGRTDGPPPRLELIRRPATGTRHARWRPGS